MNTCYGIDMTSDVVQNVILVAAASKFPIHRNGRPRERHDRLLEVFLRVLTTGMPWRAIERIDYRTAHRHFLRWARAGVFEEAYHKLLKLSRRPRKDKSFFVLDTSYVKNVFGTEVVGRNPTDRGRSATKVVALVDERGLPHRMGFVPANVSDHRVVHSVAPLPKAMHRGQHWYADKGFDSNALRFQVRELGYLCRIAKRGIATPLWWRRRQRVVERFFGALDKCRRLILRYDATIAAYSAWSWLAGCRLVSQYLS